MPDLRWKDLPHRLKRTEDRALDDRPDVALETVLRRLTWLEVRLRSLERQVEALSLRTASAADLPSPGSPE